MPVLWAALSHSWAAAHARPVDEIKPDVVGERGADGVEIAPVEMRDMALSCPLGVGQARLQRILLQRKSPSLARPRCRDVFTAGRLEWRMSQTSRNECAEHSGEDHASALRLRQPHEGAQGGARDLAARDRINVIRDHVELRVREDRRLAAPSAVAKAFPARTISFLIA